MAASRDARGRFAAKPIDELSSAYRQRVESAAARGKSLAAARGHGTAPRRQWETAEVAARPAYSKALEVLARTRRGESLTVASKAVGVAPDTVLRYAGSAYERGRRGRWVAKPTDRLYRRMRFLDGQGLTSVEPSNAKEARKLAEYWNAVDAYLATDDDRGLRRFRRASLRTRQKNRLPFVTDLRQIARFGYAGELSFEELYQH